MIDETPAGLAPADVASEEGADRPARVQVVRGAPDDLELAALVAGLAAVAGGLADEPPPAPSSAWTDRSRAMRHRTPPTTPTTPSPDAWRWSLRP